MNSSSLTSLETHRAPNTRREREEARPSTCNCCCFRLYRYLSAPTPVSIISKVSAFRPIYLVIGGFPGWKARLLCVYARRCYSPPPPRHHDGSFPLHDAEPPPSSAFSTRGPSSPFVSSSLHSLCTTSSSPIRFSGHILCSFSQVRLHYRLIHHLFMLTSLTALESLLVPHIAKV